MTPLASILRRLYWFVRLLPEIVANDIRFRVPFLLPRWFKMPARVRVAGRSIALRYPREEGVAADFISCLLRNAYGLGHELGEVRTIMDVGANLGFFALAARDRYPGALIHAYEPNPRIQGKLHENTKDFNIHIFPEAVGSQDGLVSLVDTGPSDQARTRPPDPSRPRIPQAGLQTAIDRMGGSVDLLKLDCEGAEWEILDLKDCWKSVRNIRLEYHLFDGKTKSDAIEALSRAGYALIHAPGPAEHGGMIWARRAE